MSLKQGSIVWVTVKDPAGRNPKCRPAVVVTPTSEIVPGQRIVGVAVTGTFVRPLPANQLEIPWQAGGHPVTLLYKRCVVICDWLIEFDQADIADVGGRVPTGLLHQILLQIPSDD